MKTANISLNVQAVQSRGMDKSASVKDKSFENFFSKNTANTSEKAQPANVKTSGKKEITDGFDSHKITVKADKNQTPVENEMPTEEIAEKVTTLLQIGLWSFQRRCGRSAGAAWNHTDGSDCGCYRCTTVTGDR